MSPSARPSNPSLKRLREQIGNFPVAELSAGALSLIGLAVMVFGLWAIFSMHPARSLGIFQVQDALLRLCGVIVFLWGLFVLAFGRGLRVVVEVEKHLARGGTVRE